jgi:hypothetical protein
MAAEDKFSVRVVFDIESNPPEPIGTYSGMIEDTVCYFSPVGQRVRYAPADCVLVVSVELYPARVGQGFRRVTPLGPDDVVDTLGWGQ